MSLLLIKVKVNTNATITRDLKDSLNVKPKLQNFKHVLGNTDMNMFNTTRATNF